MKRNTHTKLQERKNAHAYEYYTNPGLIREQQRDSERKWYVQNITCNTKNEDKLIFISQPDSLLPNTCQRLNMRFDLSKIVEDTSGDHIYFNGKLHLQPWLHVS
jgi:hypothetical protein